MCRILERCDEAEHERIVRLAFPDSLEPIVLTEEMRERMRRMADAYDEAEHERIVRLAFPARSPERS